MKHISNSQEAYVKYLSLVDVDTKDMEYEIYEIPSLYIIYIDDDVFDRLDDRINYDVLKQYYEKINKFGILIQPNRFNFYITQRKGRA